TLFPGHAAEEVERQVTLPVEQQMNGLPGLTRMHSFSLFGLSFVVLTFDDGTDPLLRAPAGERAPGAGGRPRGCEADARPALDPDRRDLPLHAGRRRLHANAAARARGLGDGAASEAGAGRRRRGLLRRLREAVPCAGR